MLEDEMWSWVTSDTNQNLNMIQIDSKHDDKNWIAFSFSEWPDVETTNK